MESSTQDKTIISLPVSAVSRVDVGRLLREVDAIDEFLRQSAIREPGTPVKMPKTSRLFDELIQNNAINMLRDDERKQVRDFLSEVMKSAPILHMSFSADASPQFTQRLISWLRSELHPLVLLQVGLQPNIGAGCVVRTTSKYFDFSLRTRFKEKSKELATLMRNSEAAAAQKTEVAA